MNYLLLTLVLSKLTDCINGFSVDHNYPMTIHVDGSDTSKVVNMVIDLDGFDYFDFEVSGWRGSDVTSNLTFCSDLGEELKLEFNNTHVQFKTKHGVKSFQPLKRDAIHVRYWFHYGLYVEGALLGQVHPFPVVRFPNYDVMSVMIIDGATKSNLVLEFGPNVRLYDLAEEKSLAARERAKTPPNTFGTYLCVLATLAIFLPIGFLVFYCIVPRSVITNATVDEKLKIKTQEKGNGKSKPAPPAPETVKAPGPLTPSEAPEPKYDNPDAVDVTDLRSLSSPTPVLPPPPPLNVIQPVGAFQNKDVADKDKKYDDGYENL